MSRVLPILFNTEMVRAILDGRKTVTRRVIRGRITINEAMEHKITFFPHKQRKGGIKSIKYFTMESFAEHESPYQPGDILYVRETWHKYTKRVGEGEDCHLQEFYGYKASVANSEDANEKWRPSIHMPKEAARIWLKVTDVRVERLQDITDEQAYREGVIKAHDDSFNRDYWYYKEGQNYLTGNVWAESARQCFLWGIWNGTLKKKDYNRYCNNANPWVWVIEFERCEKPEGELKNDE